MARPENPMDMLRIIVERAKEMIESNPGVKLVDYAFKPKNDEHPDLFHAMIILEPAEAFADPKTPEELAAEAEQEQFDAQFQDMFAQEQREAQKEKIREARQETVEGLRSLRREDGIGLDD